MKLGVLAAAMVLVSACASGQEPVSTTSASASTGAAPTQMASNDKGVICRREVVTGSNRTRRVCTTAEQREEANRLSRELIDRTGIYDQQQGERPL